MTNRAHKGLWFYGLAGCGKTFASTVLQSKVELAFLIDGDEVRSHISTDLGYTSQDRLKQINRMLGMAIITKKNGYFPIVSSVTMSSDVLEICNKNSIGVIEIQREFSQRKAVRSIYESATNVVGVDIRQAELDTVKLLNDGSDSFKRAVLEYVK